MLGTERMVANGGNSLGYVFEAPSVIVSDFAGFSVHDFACIAAKGVRKALAAWDEAHPIFPP